MAESLSDLLKAVVSILVEFVVFAIDESKIIGANIWKCELLNTATHAVEINVIVWSGLPSKHRTTERNHENREQTGRVGNMGANEGLVCHMLFYSNNNKKQEARDECSC